MNTCIQAYNKKQTSADREICDLLAKIISRRWCCAENCVGLHQQPNSIPYMFGGMHKNNNSV
jgi:hypothetical protein